MIGDGASTGIANIDFLLFDQQDAEIASIQILPTNALVDVNATQQFSVAALDQFGQAFEIGTPSPFSWGASQGQIDENGLFTATDDITESALFIEASLAGTEINGIATAHMAGLLNANPDLVTAVNAGGPYYLSSAFSQEDEDAEGALKEPEVTDKKA